MAETSKLESSLPGDKVKVTLRQTGNTPALVNKTFWVQRSQTVRWVVEFIKQQLRCQPHESLFVYVQQAFAPSLDQDISTLYECYGANDKLILNYCKTPAWG